MIALQMISHCYSKQSSGWELSAEPAGAAGSGARSCWLQGLKGLKAWGAGVPHKQG